MNRTFRTVSALLRHFWLIEESYAHAHEPLINAFLAGRYPTDELAKQVDPLTIAFALAPPAVASSRSQLATPRFALDDPTLPDNSVLVVNVQGAMMKDGFCGSAGSMQYAGLINDAYANDKVVGVVVVMDSPGGQVSGTSTFYDAVRNLAKPTVSLVQEGTAASAAYWAICGSDYIMASQQADQIGSIGVFVRLRDTTKAEELAGVKTMTVYSRRSTEKNKPYRDALAGDTTALEDDLDQTADLFRAAVVAGRGDRLKPVKKGGPDVFEGGLFYAGQAIELGLIDGYGDLNAAVAKVYELSATRENKPASSGPGAGVSIPEFESTGPAPVAVRRSGRPASEQPASAAETTAGPGGAPRVGGTGAVADIVSPTTTNQPTNSSTMSIFGYSKLVALTAIAGIAADAVTAEQVTAINAELEANGFAVAAISQADFVEATSLKATLATANGALTTANAQVATLTAEVARLGLQPGAIPTKAEKTEEKTAAEPDTIISEADAEMARMLAATPQPPKALQRYGDPAGTV